MKLYFAPGACSFVPHTLLEISGAAFEPMLVKLHRNEQNSPEFLAVNPRGQVPVLEAEGKVIDQIVAICLYIDQKFPQCNFLPIEPVARAKAISVLAWMNNTVHATFTHVFMPGKFSADAEVQAAIKTHATGQFHSQLREINAMTQAIPAGEWLSGKECGPLDAYALTLLRWGSFSGMDPTSLNYAWAHVNRVAQVAGVARAIERERLQLNLFKSA